MKSQTVLIVEEHPQMRRTLKCLLGDAAVVCSECDNGAEVAAAYELHHPDWVLMDIKLPGMDGLIATAALCAADPSARVVIVTNYDDPAIREAAARAGACGFIAKDNLLELRTLFGRGEMNPVFER